MPGYLDANELVVKSDYLKAKYDLDTGTEASLQSAEIMFDSLGDYVDAMELAKQARYQRAEKLLSDGKVFLLKEKNRIIKTQILPSLVSWMKLLQSEIKDVLRHLMKFGNIYLHWRKGHMIIRL
jgi:hypothetical protein